LTRTQGLADNQGMDGGGHTTAKQTVTAMPQMVFAMNFLRYTRGILRRSNIRFQKNGKEFFRLEAFSIASISSFHGCICCWLLLRYAMAVHASSVASSHGLIPSGILRISATARLLSRSRYPSAQFRSNVLSGREIHTSCPCSKQSL